MIFDKHSSLTDLTQRLTAYPNQRSGAERNGPSRQWLRPQRRVPTLGVKSARLKQIINPGICSAPAWWYDPLGASCALSPRTFAPDMPRAADHVRSFG